MARLGDLASVIRSKNAGPFQVTIDIMFANAGDYRRVLGSRAFTAAEVAKRYRIAEGDVAVIPFERVHAIKITIPRRWAAGAADRPATGMSMGRNSTGRSWTSRSHEGSTVHPAQALTGRVENAAARAVMCSIRPWRAVAPRAENRSWRAGRTLIGFC